MTARACSRGLVRARASAVRLGVAFAVAAVACRAPADPGFACTTEARAGINVTVVDSLTGKAESFTGLWLRARDGSYVDSTTMAFPDAMGQMRMAAAYERKGTYAVTVHADGYRDWSKLNVVVTADRCHVIPVQLTARLAKPAG